MKLKNTGITSREELEAQVRICCSEETVKEVRVSAACNERIIHHDGRGVNGIYVDAIAVVVDEGQDHDLICIGKSGR